MFSLNFTPSPPYSLPLYPHYTNHLSPFQSLSLASQATPLISLSLLSNPCRTSSISLCTATDSELSNHICTEGGIEQLGASNGRVGGEGNIHIDEVNEDEQKITNRSNALTILAEAKRGLDTLPLDLKAAIEDGMIPGLIVVRYLQLEKSGFLLWLMKFVGFKERLLADDLFLAKIAMECGIGMFTKTAAEYERRGDIFLMELEIVLADVVMAVIADFMLVYLPAPTVLLRPSIALNPGRLFELFYNCPDNAFQVALPGSSYSVFQRIGAIVGNGMKLFAVGTTSSLVATVITNALVSAQSVVDHSAADNVPVLSTSVAYGVYMALSSNIRYQVVAGVIEQRILEPLLSNNKPLLGVTCFAVRTGNTFLGSLLWVDYARFLGIQ